MKESANKKEKSSKSMQTGSEKKVSRDSHGRFVKNEIDKNISEREKIAILLNGLNIRDRITVNDYINSLKRDNDRLRRETKLMNECLFAVFDIVEYYLEMLLWCIDNLGFFAKRRFGKKYEESNLNEFTKRLVELEHICGR